MNYQELMAAKTDPIEKVTLTPEDVNLTSPATANNATLQDALGIVYFVAGIVCVVIIIMGGVRYTLSGGDSGKVASAKNTIIYAVAGLVVILIAASVTQFIFGEL